MATVLLVILFITSGLNSPVVSSTPTYEQDDVIDVTHQRRLQRQSRAPDVAFTEDSYLEALKHSRDSRRKGSAPTFHHPHANPHESSSHGIVQGADHHVHTHFHPETPKYEYASTSRPLTAMEKNYLKPKKPPTFDERDVTDVEQSIDEEQSAEEEQSEEEEHSEELIESDASTQFVRLVKRSNNNAASANLAYSTYSSANLANVMNPKRNDIKTVQLIANKSDEQQTNRIATKHKHQILIKLPESMEQIKNRAASVFRNGMRNVGSTVNMLNSLTNRIHTWLPAVNAVGRRKKRSVSDEENNNKDDIKKRQSTNGAHKTSSTNNRPLRFRFQKLSPNSKKTFAHSSDKRLASSKFQNLKTTKLKRVLPWFYFKLSSRNQKGTVSREADDIERNENLLDKSDSNLITSSFLTQKSSSDDTQNVKDTLLNKGGPAHVDHSKFTHGHGIVVASVPGSSSVKDTVAHGIVSQSNDLSPYTHGHGVIVPNEPLINNPSLGESSLVSNVVDNQNILAGFINGTAPNPPSSTSNLIGDHDVLETGENISPVDSLIASLDGPVLTTGVFEDEIDLALDDLESLMTDIIIAPLQVEAVVAEGGSSNETTAESPDSSDAVIIEAAEGNQPDSIPVVSNLAHLLVASSGSNPSSSSSSSSSSSISSGGVTGGDTSAVSVDPFPLIYTIGLAAIGIFVLTLPIWVPFVVARMKKRRNSFSRRSPFIFPIGSINNDAEFHSYSTLLHQLTPSDDSFNNPGPLNSEDLYGPEHTNYFDRKAAARRRR